MHRTSLSLSPGLVFTQTQEAEFRMPEGDIKYPHPESSSDSSPLFDVHPQVFFISAAFIVGFVAFTFFYQKVVGDFFGPLLGAISTNVGWFFIWTMNIILFFALYLMFSRYGDIRLGGDDDHAHRCNDGRDRAGWLRVLVVQA